MIDLARVGDRLLHGIARDLAELDPKDRLAAWNTGGLGDMPGDRLALAIRVGREIDCVSGPDRFLQRRDDLFFAFGYLIHRHEAAVDIHAQVALGQIAHMAHGRFDAIAGAEIFLNRLRLGGRLNDHELVCHTYVSIL